mmetsp:Transcript_16436/g.57447  ORF Transcript_16436/g.57447 Transcript_16436/m.57447 type:complete len:508 (-) Transcript_16436:49-1572(-)
MAISTAFMQGTSPDNRPTTPAMDFQEGASPTMEDPLADVLEWLGKTRYDVQEPLPTSPLHAPSVPSAPSARSMVPQEPASDDFLPGLDVSEECAERGGPTHMLPRQQAHMSRQLSPKLDKAAPAPRTLSRGGPGTPGSLKEAGNAGEESNASKLVPSGLKSSLLPACPPACPSLCACPSSSSGSGPKVRRDMMDDEEAEWEMRQRKSGTVGRLVVYNSGERPKEDVVLRGGGAKRHIVVAGVREGGQAARAGVRAGDRLVSIDGRKDFIGLTADAVREMLQAPTLLVFLGFVGKLQAEVRLTNADHVCGISYRREVLRGSFEAPVQVCEESIFNAGLASLFLTVSGSAGNAASNRDAAHQPLFELQNSEAKGLIRRALRRVEPQEAMSVASTIPQEVQQQPSLTSAPPLWSNPPQPAYGPGVPGPAALGPSIGRLAMSDDGSPASEAAAAAVAAALASEVKDGPKASRQPPVDAGDRWPSPMLSSMPITAGDQHLGFHPNQRLSSNV